MIYHKGTARRLWFMDRAWHSSFFGIIFAPLSFLYRAAAQLRSRWCIVFLMRMPVPVVVVGNISVGGTGKSSVVRYLAALLKKRGYKPGIVSRGYGGHYKEACLVSAKDDAGLMGDEAVMLARDYPLAVGKSRAYAIQLLLQNQCNVILSDDGLQHYQLARDIEIILIDEKRGLGNGYCLPAGPLREPASRLMRADYIALKKSSKPAALDNILAPYPRPIFKFSYKPHSWHRLDKKKNFALKPLPFDRQCNAVAGISDPSRFFGQLSALGLKTENHAFVDHHPYCDEDLVFDNDWPIVMTEKDAVKCTHLSNTNLKRCWFLEITAEFNKDFIESFLDSVAQCSY